MLYDGLKKKKKKCYNINTSRYKEVNASGEV